MNRQSITLAAALIVLVGCQRETESAGNVHAATNSRDENILVGTFSGERPVHPEGSINETLVLNADGTFLLTAADPMMKSDKAMDAFKGTWTAELAGARIRLHPRTGENMLFAIYSNEVLIPLDSDGNSIDSKSIGLRRKKSGH
jgi:uncharacterized lipoprotein NlpE involved in copper resistance